MQLDILIVGLAVILVLATLKIEQQPKYTRSLKLKNHNVIWPMYRKTDSNNFPACYVTLEINGEQVVMLLDTGFSGPPVLNPSRDSEQSIMAAVPLSSIKQTKIKLIGLSSEESIQAKQLGLSVAKIGTMSFVSHSLKHHTSIMTLDGIRSLLPAAFLWGQNKLELLSQRSHNATVVPTITPSYSNKFYQILLHVNGVWLFAVMDTGFAGSLYLNAQAADKLHFCTDKRCVSTTQDINGAKANTRSVRCTVACVGSQFSCPVLVGSDANQTQNFVGLLVLQMFDIYVDAQHLYLQANAEFGDVHAENCSATRATTALRCSLKVQHMQLPPQQSSARKERSRDAEPSNFYCACAYNCVVIDCEKIQTALQQFSTSIPIRNMPTVAVLDNMITALTTEDWKALIELQTTRSVFISHAVDAADDAALIKHSSYVFTLPKSKST